MADAPTLSPLLDRLIAWAAPARALRRQRARLAIEALRTYEGATKSRRTEGWRAAHGTSGNTELLPALPTLRDRSRDHVRNNPYGRRVVRRLASALVGYGMTGTITGPNQRTVDALQWEWDQFANARTCDQRGKQTFGGLQRLVARTFGESGEVLARRIWDETAPMGFRIQVLEPDYLDVPATGYPRAGAAGHRVVGGIELDPNDRPVAYFLLPQHPGESWAGVLQPPIRVPAADVAHIFDEERPGQVRGCPLLAPVMIPLRDLDETKDAHQVRQKIAACFAAFYTTPDGSTRTKQDPLCDHVEPGMTEELPPGWEVTFSEPPDVGGYDDVMRIGLQATAAGTSVPYEDISGDYSQFNFASGRMSRGAFYELVEELQWQVIIPGFCDRGFAWFLEAAQIQGYETANVAMTWTPPRRPIVDPSREIPMAIAAVRATLTSPQEAIRELGYDPRKLLEDWDQFADWLDEMDLVSDLDPRHTTMQGGRVPLPTDTDADRPAAANGARARRRAGRRPPPRGAPTNGHAPPG